MNTKQLYYSYYYFIYYVYVYFYRFLYLCGLYTPPIKPKTDAQLQKEYCNQKRATFKRFLNNPNRNDSIDPLFYNKTSYELYMQDQNTHIEKKWKSRILLETTPRGNVLMYYDAYKMGFAYFFDQTSMSHEILNACAMKYVQTFRCSDFFVDEIELLQLETIETKNATIENEITELVKKNNNLMNWHYTPLKLTHAVSKSLKNKNENIRNKFMYLGKISNGNCLLLQAPEKKKNSLLFKSSLLENMGSEQNRLSYRDFKQKNSNH